MQLILYPLPLFFSCISLVSCVQLCTSLQLNKFSCVCLSSHKSSAPLMVLSANWPSSMWKIEARRRPIFFQICSVRLIQNSSDQIGFIGSFSVCNVQYAQQTFSLGHKSECPLGLNFWLPVQTFNCYITISFGCYGNIPYLSVSSAVRSFFLMIKSLDSLLYSQLSVLVFARTLS